MKVFVIDKQKETNKYISYIVKLESNFSYKDKFILNIYKNNEEENDDEYYSKYGYFKYGDIIKINGKIIIPKTLNNLYEFNYKRYLNSTNIFGVISTYDAIKIDKIGNNYISYIYKYKGRLNFLLEKRLPKMERDLFKAIIYGESLSLEKDFKDNVSKLGLSHILSISGINITIILYIILYIFNKVKINYNIYVVFSIGIIISLCILVEFKISLLRAAIITIISFITNVTAIKLNKFSPIIAAFILIYLYNPYSIFNASFILSFSALLGIILFKDQINSYLNIWIFRLTGVYNIKKCENIIITYKYKVLKFISNFLSFYFSIQIIIFPIQIYLFNSFSLISLLSNFVIYIFINLVLILGYLYVLFNFMPFISNILLNFNYLILKVVIIVINHMSFLNPIEINLPRPNSIIFLSYYILVIIFFYGYKLEYFLKYKLRILNIKWILKLTWILLLIIIISYNIYIIYFLDFVYFFNVEQGNMALIKSGRTAIVVDMGSISNINLGGILINFMKAFNLNKIDFLIITHLHSDHVSGFFKLEDKLINKEIIIDSVIYQMPKNNGINIKTYYKIEEKGYLEFENYLNKMKIKQIMVEGFDEIQVDSKTRINILSPKDKEIILSKDISNSNSVVALITSKNTNYLFMGDSTLESEYILMNKIKDLENKEYYLNKLKNLKAMQIGHHGSNTSTSEEFIKFLNIKNAVISSKKSVYGHPNIKVLEILKKYKTPTKITEVEGGIMIKP